MLRSSYYHIKNMLDAMVSYSQEWRDDAFGSRIIMYQTRRWKARGEINNVSKRLPRRQAQILYCLLHFLATSDIFKNGMPEKMTNPSSFTVPCSIGEMDLGRALCNLRVSINLMLLSIFKKLEIREVQPTHIRLYFADKFIAKPEDKIKDFPTDDENCNVIEFLGWNYFEKEAYQELFSTEEFFEEDDPSYILKEVNVVSSEKKFESLDLQIKGEKKTKPSIEEPPELELKSLPNHLKYVYLRENDTLPVSISTHLDVAKEKELLNMLKRHKKEIEWTLVDIQGISSSYCMHKVRLEEGQERTIQFKRRLNLTMKEVVKKEIIKWLDERMIYPIVDSE
ncbi:uncharacterized protein E5676_scaffold675G00260 [Cucumis melo var. makuwa]|uniref:Uncharacterized protein n=1 Tax=Cucumis melo var. makuwa TaxID=1194695 RepID=A0A5A7UF79_CUCMM|nr:uncharacterized protein E6C27_scaffold33G00230 [Cucumis melo var. makuwa]TYK04359.1 uncharacterized protein E5676_scaffold675G00260 [Cucumis melo var. makuwa]